MRNDENPHSDGAWTPLPGDHPDGPLAKMRRDARQAVERVDVPSSGMIAPTFEQLQKMTDDELRAAYDGMTPTTAVGTGFLLDELRRRDAGRTTKTALKVSIGSLVVSVLALLVGLSGLGVAMLRDTTISVPAPEVTVLPAPVVVQPAPPAP